jgi:hypothetical protein
MKLYWIILIANSVTMLVTISAAIKRSITSYRLIAGTALVAAVFSLHQVLVDRYSIYSLLFTLLLIVMIAWRGILNARGRSQRKR